jgi:hypothetical protein
VEFAVRGALETLIEAHAIELKLPTVRRRFKVVAEEALREQQPPWPISRRSLKQGWQSAQGAVDVGACWKPVSRW